MKNQIKIHNPCPENWDNMQDFPSGKFCDKCSKCVIDFTDKTDKADKIEIYYDNNKMYFTIYDNYNNTIHILEYEKNKIKNHLKFTGQKSSKIIDLNHDNKLDFIIINENQLTNYFLNRLIS